MKRDWGVLEVRGKAVEGKVSCTSNCLVTYVKKLLLWAPDACLVYWDIVSSLYTSCQPCQQLQDLRQEMYLYECWNIPSLPDLWCPYCNTEWALCVGFALMQPDFCIREEPYMHSWSDSRSGDVPMWQATEFTFKAALKCCSLRSRTS